MFRSNFWTRAKIPIPPRNLISSDPNVQYEPFFSQSIFQWSDPLIEKTSEYLSRAVNLQRKIMAKAGVTDPSLCNCVEVEIRLGQLSLRKNAEKQPTDQSNEKGKTPNEKSGRQTRHYEALLHLPVSSPCIIDEKACSFISGWKISGRCDGFFSIPVIKSLEKKEFTEIPNSFVSTRVIDKAVSSSCLSIERKRMTDEGYEDESEHVFEKDEESERDVVAKYHRVQTSIDVEDKLTQCLPRTSGYVPGFSSRAELGVVDLFGSDQLALPPFSWARKIDTVSSYGENGEQALFKESPNDHTEFRVIVLTNDGYRVEFQNGMICTGGEKFEEEWKVDGYRSGLIKKLIERSSTFQNFFDKLSQGNVRTTLLQTSNTTFKDIALGTEYFVQNYFDRETAFTLGQHFFSNSMKLLTKTRVAKCNYRMPRWGSDCRLSVAVERSSNDDLTPFTVNLNNFFPSEEERILPRTERKRYEEGSAALSEFDERQNRSFSIIRFLKRMEFRLLRFDVGVKNFHAQRIAAVIQWFDLPESQPFQGTLHRAGPAGFSGCVSSASYTNDPISDAFLLLYVSDVYNSLDQGPKNGQRSETLPFSDARNAIIERGYLLSRPTSNDHRSREVEVELNMPALIKVLDAHQDKFSKVVHKIETDPSLSDKERIDIIAEHQRNHNFQLHELFCVIATRMFDALGSYSRLP